MATRACAPDQLLTVVIVSAALLFFSTCQPSNSGPSGPVSRITPQQLEAFAQSECNIQYSTVQNRVAQRPADLKMFRLRRHKLEVFVNSSDRETKAVSLSYSGRAQCDLADSSEAIGNFWQLNWHWLLCHLGLYQFEFEFNWHRGWGWDWEIWKCRDYEFGIIFYIISDINRGAGMGKW